MIFYILDYTKLTKRPFPDSPREPKPCSNHMTFIHDQKSSRSIYEVSPFVGPILASTLTSPFHHPPPSPNSYILGPTHIDDADLLGPLLMRLTKRSTFPNTIIRGKSIGGSDELHALHADGSLRKIIEGAGVVVGADGVGKAEGKT